MGGGSFLNPQLKRECVAKRAGTFIAAAQNILSRLRAKRAREQRRSRASDQECEMRGQGSLNGQSAGVAGYDLYEAPNPDL